MLIMGDGTFCGAPAAMDAAFMAAAFAAAAAADDIPLPPAAVPPVLGTPAPEPVGMALLRTAADFLPLPPLVRREGWKPDGIMAAALFAPPPAHARTQVHTHT